MVGEEERGGRENITNKEKEGERKGVKEKRKVVKKITLLWLS